VAQVKSPGAAQPPAARTEDRPLSFEDEASVRRLGGPRLRSNG